MKYWWTSNTNKVTLQTAYAMGIAKTRIETLQAGPMQESYSFLKGRMDGLGWIGEQSR